MNHSIGLLVIVAGMTVPLATPDQHSGAPLAAPASAEAAVELRCSSTNKIMCYEPLALTLRITNLSGGDVLLKEPVLGGDSAVRARAVISSEVEEQSRVYKYPLLHAESVNELGPSELGQRLWAKGAILDVGLVIGYDFARRQPVFEQAGKYNIKLEVDVNGADYVTNEVSIVVKPPTEAEAAAVAIVKKMNSLQLYDSMSLGPVELNDLTLIAEDRTSIVLSAYARLRLAHFERGSAIQELPLSERRQHLLRAKELLEGIRCSSADMQLSKQYDATVNSVQEALDKIKSTSK